MKKITLLTLLIAFSIYSFAQEKDNQQQWTLSFGVDAINNSGESASPLSNLGDSYFGTPISGALEYSWINNFAIEGALTLNSFIDNDIYFTNPDKEHIYVSLDAHAKYYFKDLIFRRGKMNWFDMYANVGAGYFNIDKRNLSANVGGGLLFWLNKEQNFGIRAQAIAKIGLNDNDTFFYDNSHFQYHLQPVIKL